MADIRECNVREPHRGHTWTGARDEWPGAPKATVTYHMCPGKFRGRNGEDLFNKAREAVEEKGSLRVESGGPGFVDQVIARLFDAGFLADPASVVTRPVGEDHDSLLEEHIHSIIRPVGLTAAQCIAVAGRVAEALNRGELKPEMGPGDQNADIAQEEPQEPAPRGVWATSDARITALPEPVAYSGGGIYIPAGYAMVNGRILPLPSWP